MVNYTCGQISPDSSDDSTKIANKIQIRRIVREKDEKSIRNPRFLRSHKRKRHLAR